MSSSVTPAQRSASLEEQKRLQDEIARQFRERVEAIQRSIEVAGRTINTPHPVAPNRFPDDFVLPKGLEDHELNQDLADLNKAPLDLNVLMMALLVAVIPQLIVPLLRKLFRTNEEVRLANEAAALHQRMTRLGLENGWSMEDLQKIRLPTLDPPSTLQTIFLWTLISFQLGVYFIVLMALIQQMMRVYVWQTSTARRMRTRNKPKKPESNKKK
ncbi:hypothetical protein SISSUDRAFT_1051089 [Sistotremastrum suecicum HHB10207 ss-3]|uniref:Uncharacterized protein n=1 Tax=Sistotremastrum suecicum HHB10207 ss-3 TaxID=1314776 RepID=A0A166ATN1_9AGAM|nr:hypothetical protein SISSUDRAFT_1051089 [Sistotremastrum suecicum HHB10207 ss-3]